MSESSKREKTTLLISSLNLVSSSLHSFSRYACGMYFTRSISEKSTVSFNFFELTGYYGSNSASHFGRMMPL
ncbi:hypothetical protein, partial [uncultured Sphingobacterium sp.]|uniref:hypothetical protein n=1 Tax=uncultured Sphingobacterium sp. TaxID=182688 RepID=UPI0025973A68